MWWLSQAKLKDVLNCWICSSFQPMSAQNIPHLDPRGSWKHFCGTPGELNCTLLMYRMSCKRYWTKIRSLGEAPRFREQNTWTRWCSLEPLLIPIPEALGFLCSGGQCVCSAAKTHLVSSLVPDTIFDRKNGLAPIVRESWPRTSNCRGRAERHRDTVVATSAKWWPKQGGKGQANGCSGFAHVGFASGVTKHYENLKFIWILSHRFIGSLLYFSIIFLYIKRKVYGNHTDILLKALF